MAKADPLFSVTNAFSGIDTKDVDLIHIRMKANITSSVNIYPLIEGDSANSAQKIMTARYKEADT